MTLPSTHLVKTTYGVSKQHVESNLAQWLIGVFDIWGYIFYGCLGTFQLKWVAEKSAKIQTRLDCWKTESFAKGKKKLFGCKNSPFRQDCLSSIKPKAYEPLPAKWNFDQSKIQNSDVCARKKCTCLKISSYYVHSNSELYGKNLDLVCPIIS